MATGDRPCSWAPAPPLCFSACSAAAALQNILFKVKPLDPFIYLAVAGLLTLVAAASCFVPARRATRVNPMVALRTE